MRVCKQSIPLLTVVAVLLALGAGCASAPAVQPVVASLPPPPRPSQTPYGLPPPPTVTPEAAVPPRPGLTRYPSWNEVRALAFAPDGALWAAVSGGVARWDLEEPGGRLFGVRDGLGSSDVRDVLALANGEVWVATATGASRFDGSAWRNFDTLDGLPEGVVNALAVAPDGAIWAATSAGLAVFRGTDWRVIGLDDGLPDLLIWQVAVAPGGEVWASTHAGGVVKVNPETLWAEVVPLGAAIPYPNARFLTIAPDGTPWLHVGYDNVYAYRGGEWKLAFESTGGRWVCDIAFGADGEPWIGTCGGFHAHGTGLAHRQGADWTQIGVADGLVSEEVTTVAVRADGVVAAGSDRGIAVLRDGRWTPLREGPTLQHVTSIAVDRAGVVWAGFGDDQWQASKGGVARFDGTGWTYPSLQAGGGDENVQALAAAPDGSVWAGAGCNLVRIRQDKAVPVVGCDRLRSRVRSIAFGEGDAVWAATDFDLVRVEGASGVNPVASVYSGILTLAVVQAKDGAVWAGLSPLAGGGLRRLSEGQWLPAEPAAPFEIVPWLAAGPRGELYAAGAEGQGVARLAAGRWEMLGSSLPDGGIRRLALSPEGEVWASTPGGMARLDRTRWEEWDLGLVGAGAFAFAPDGSMWIATERGVARWTRD